jgi:hypothetical protein
MILTVHNLAETYKLLPSEILHRGSTFDLYVLDVYSRYVKYQEAKSSGKAVPVEKKYTIEELMAMRDRVKKQSEERSSGDKISS